MTNKSIDTIVNETITKFKKGEYDNSFKYGITYRKGKFYSYVSNGNIKEIDESRARSTIKLIEKILID